MHVALGHDNGALDHVLQLPHVARPMKPLQHLHRRGDDGFGRAALGLGEFFQEIIDQQRNVLAAARATAECESAPR